MDTLDISISGSAEQVQALLAGIASRAADRPPQIFGGAMVAAHPRINDPWPGIPGSAYAGLARAENGEPDGHIVLLGDDPDRRLDWAASVAWGLGLGNAARLPTAMEAALLYANLKDQFKTDALYWTGTQFSAGSAWSQGFNGGGQFSSGKSYEGRCRAVRRFAA